MLDFYRSVFGGDDLVLQTFADGPPDMGVPESERHKIMHATLKLGAGILMGSDIPISMAGSIGGALVVGNISPCPIARPARQGGYR